MNQRNIEIGQTIIQQIGGRAFYMLGQRGPIVITDNGIQFGIGRNEKRVNKIRVTLNGLDLYDVEFYNVRRCDWKKVSEETNIYFDQLHAAIERNTGMYTSL